MWFHSNSAEMSTEVHPRRFSRRLRPPRISPYRISGKHLDPPRAGLHARVWRRSQTSGPPPSAAVHAAGPLWLRLAVLIGKHDTRRRWTLGLQPPPHVVARRSHANWFTYVGPAGRRVFAELAFFCCVALAFFFCCSVSSGRLRWSALRVSVCVCAFAPLTFNYAHVLVCVCATCDAVHPIPRIVDRLRSAAGAELNG